jgi:hypothetical protein
MDGWNKSGSQRADQDVFGLIIPKQNMVGQKFTSSAKKSEVVWKDSLYG